MKKNFLCAYSLIIIFVSCIGQAKEPNWYAEGLRLESEGDIQAAIESYKLSADKGLSDAKFALGRLYQSELKDDENSFKWFLKAAEQGNYFAQHEVGLMHRYGNAVISIDEEKARHYFIKAVKRGHLGESAFELFKLSKLEEEKFVWLKKSAEYGLVEAMKVLGQAYSDGSFGNKIDPVQTQVWLERASNAQE